ncbi:hypothetical protein CRUP_036729 [Coryphaenoides rupestris]|nr:hypothetical protein CRUP_036729 [Coryphaenoides rupestris]
MVNPTGGPQPPAALVHTLHRTLCCRVHVRHSSGEESWPQNQKEVCENYRGEPHTVEIQRKREDEDEYRATRPAAAATDRKVVNPTNFRKPPTEGRFRSQKDSWPQNQKEVCENYRGEPHTVEIQRKREDEDEYRATRPAAAATDRKVVNPTNFRKPPTEGRFRSQKDSSNGRAGTSSTSTPVWSMLQTGDCSFTSSPSSLAMPSLIWLEPPTNFLSCQEKMRMTPPHCRTYQRNQSADTSWGSDVTLTLTNSVAKRRAALGRGGQGQR